MIPDTSTLAVFVLTALLILLTPGPAVFYIVVRSMEQGRVAGVVSTLGVHVGTLVHIAAAALGVSALLASSALAFTVVKYLGAAYLVWLGVRKLLGRDESRAVRTPARRRLSELLMQGAIVNVLNPKTALFFFAFLPQFVDVEAGAVAVQIVVLGLIFIFLGILSDGLYALLAGSVGDRLRADARLWRVQRYFAGSVFIALGVAAALTEQGRR